MSEAAWSLSATQLAQRLADGRLSSRDAVEAHLARIDALDPQLRAFTSVLATEARAEATARDTERAEGKVRGPLHGLPVTLKECFDLEGLPTTLGLSSRTTARARRDAALVTALREAGAVILGRTNLSQTMLFAESRNPLFGQTANAFSRDHTSGGSSGGEATAVAAGMSPLGFGTDIGGSIRSPAAFSGICGFKPTLDRWPMRGVGTVLVGQEAVRSQCGPMARTVADLALAFEALNPARLSAIDPRVPPLPWASHTDVDVSSLRVGYYTDDGMIPVSRAVARGVERARDLLRARGLTAVPFTPPDVPGMMELYVKAVSADGIAALIAAVGDDPIDPSLQGLARVAKLSPRVRGALSRAAVLAGQDRSARLLDSLGEKPVSAFWALVDALRAYRHRLVEALDRAQLDIVLCPAYATPALPHGMSKNFTLASSPAMVWNVVQFPAGVVPVTRVRPEETTRPHPRDLLERHAARVDAQSAGLPVGVQVVARPWRDHEALAVMAALEAALHDAPDCPRTPIDPR
jgi:fatty acid amide hydrolase